MLEALEDDKPARDDRPQMLLVDHMNHLNLPLQLSSEMYTFLYKQRIKIDAKQKNAVIDKIEYFEERTFINISDKSISSFTFLSMRLLNLFPNFMVPGAGLEPARYF